MKFGSALLSMRKGANLSQEQMAEKLLKARSSISKLERDQLELKAIDLVEWIKITNNHIKAAAFILEVDKNDLKQALQIMETNKQLDKLMDV